MRPDRCDACDKIVYRSAEAALDAITAMQGFTRWTGPVRAYPCPFNPGWWHLTSRHTEPKHRRGRRPRIS